jgi:hypothetical protein
MEHVLRPEEGNDVIETIQMTQPTDDKAERAEESRLKP